MCWRSRVNVRKAIYFLVDGLLKLREKDHIIELIMFLIRIIKPRLFR